MAKSFETILDEMLNCVSGTVDKREGSLIWSALAPTAAQLAEAYAYLDSYTDLMMADTAVGTYLERLCGLMGISRRPATFAVLRGEFKDADGAPQQVEIGSDFVCGADLYTVSSEISTGKYRLTAKTAGTAANRSFGTLLPVDYIDGLMSAEITGIESRGEDVEADESLRLRYIECLTVPAFGGNVPDYEKKILSFAGIGAVKVFPVCNGAGTVGAVVCSADRRAVDSAMTVAVANEFNKRDEQNMVCGLAPIGHTVYIKSAEELPITVNASVTLKEDAALDAVFDTAKKAVRNYIESIGFNQDIIHSAPLEVAILSSGEIIKINSLTINGQSKHLTLDKTYEGFQIPIFAALNLEVQ